MAMTDVTVVLAHGGWADGSSWGRVITGLAAHGVKSVAFRRVALLSMVVAAACAEDEAARR